MEDSELGRRAADIAGRAAQCARMLERESARVRMAFGIDGGGRCLVATTDPAAYLRCGIGLRGDERLIDSSGNPEDALAAALRVRAGAVVSATMTPPVAASARLRARGIAVVPRRSSRLSAQPLRHRLTTLGPTLCAILAALESIRTRSALLAVLPAVVRSATTAGGLAAANPERDLVDLEARLEAMAADGDLAAFRAARALAVGRCHPGGGRWGMADALYEAAFALGGPGALCAALDLPDECTLAGAVSRERAEVTGSADDRSSSDHVGDGRSGMPVRHLGDLTPAIGGR